MKLRRAITACVYLGLASLAFPTAAWEEPKIGGIGTLSGGGTAWGLAVLRGIQMAIDGAKAASGLKIGNKTNSNFNDDVLPISAAHGVALV